MKNILLAIAGSLFVTTTLCVAASEAKLTMSVEPVVSGPSEISLKFRLRYDGARSIEAEVGTLPGAQRKRTVRLTVERLYDYDAKLLDTCSTPEEIPLIDDASGEARTIISGQEFVGVDKLGDFFRNLSGAVGNCDVLIHWSYKMYTRGRIRFPRMTGSIVIPANLRTINPPDVSVLSEPWTP